MRYFSDRNRYGTGARRKAVMRVKCRYVVLTCLLGICQQASAQIIPRANLVSTYTDNLFQSISGKSAWINHAYIDLDYAHSADMDLYYTGNANVFSEHQDLFNHTHSAGLSWVRTADDSEVLHAGGELSVRLGRPLYDYRDFLRADAFVSNKRYINETLLSRYGYSLRLQEFVNAQEYSFLEQKLHGQLSKFPALPDHPSGAR